MFLLQNSRIITSQILGPEENWDLNKESVTYRTPTLNAKISARVTNESAVVDNEGSLWCVIEDRLSVVSITDGQLQKKSWISST